jgi:hypothetical protein
MKGYHTKASLSEEMQLYCTSLHRISFKGWAIVGMDGGECGAEIQISQVNV